MISKSEKLEKATAATLAPIPKRAKPFPPANNIKKAMRVKPTKPAESILNTQQRVINSIMKKARVKELPLIGELFKGMDGRPMRIRDIAIFLGDNPGEGEKHGDVLSEMAQVLPHRNTVNLNAEVTLAQVMSVGVEILEAGCAYMPICVAHLTDGSKLNECWSGRHRLAFLALAYGPEAEVPVSIRAGSTQQIRDAVIYANSSRSVQAMEKIDHAVLRATGGKKMNEVDRDELYVNMSSKKAQVVKFCVKSAIDEVRGMKLDFPISERKGRQGKVMAGAVEKFFQGAIDWNDQTTRPAVDKQIRDAVTFINAVYANLIKQPDFDVCQQFSNKSMGALGKMVPILVTVCIGEENGILKYVPAITEKLISMGKIGSLPTERLKSELKAYVDAVRKREVAA